MRLLIYADGIPITYNGSEKNVETVFALDDEANIIQRFTFDCDIHCELPTKDIVNFVNIKNGFLFYSFRYQVSFAHFLTQTVPLLMDYINNYSDYKLLIPKHHFNMLCKDILKYVNIAEDNVVLLEDKTIYTIDNLAPRSPSEDVWEVNNKKLSIYCKLRESLQIEPNVNGKRRIYLKKDGNSSSEYGNSEIGIIRKINNESELIDELSKRGFEIITLGTKTVKEKYDLLKDAEIVITQLGANMMNFIFTNAPKNLIMLSNDRPIGVNLYIDLVNELNNTKINTTCFYYPPSGEIDHTNQWNSAFSVSVTEIINHLDVLDAK